MIRLVRALELNLNLPFNVTCLKWGGTFIGTLVFVNLYPADTFATEIFLAWSLALHCFMGKLVAYTAFVVLEELGVCNVVFGAEDGNGFLYHIYRLIAATFKPFLNNLHILNL